MISERLSGSANWSLCHGLLGNLDLLLHARHALGPRHEPLIDAVQDFGDTQFIQKRRPWVYDTPASEPLTGLMLGTAGTGYAYLRAASPTTVPSALMIGPGALASDTAPARSVASQDSHTPIPAE